MLVLVRGAALSRISVLLSGQGAFLGASHSRLSNTRIVIAGLFSGELEHFFVKLFQYVRIFLSQLFLEEIIDFFRDCLDLIPMSRIIPGFLLQIENCFFEAPIFVHEMFNVFFKPMLCDLK